jgi:hypothetical protein
MEIIQWYCTITSVCRSQFFGQKILGVSGPHVKIKEFTEPQKTGPNVRRVPADWM